METISNRGRGRPFPPSYLDKLYPIPRPMVLLDEWKRLYGRDLEALDDVTLLQERRCITRRADYESDPARRAWLMQRLAAIDRERETRRAPTARGQAPRQRTRPTAQTVMVAGKPIELPLTSGRRDHE